MMRPLKACGALVGVCMLVGCFGGARGGAADEPGGDERTTRGGHTIIVPEEGGSTYRTLLQLIQARMPNLQVRRITSCPEVEFRGRQSMQQSNPPAIYVQGQRSANTCILEMLSLNDVERVEVYPMGQGFRSGYAGTSGGLILIYLKDGV